MARRLQRGITASVPLPVELGRVEPDAVGLDDEVGADHAEVDPTDPVVAAYVDLPLGGYAGLVQNVDEPCLQARRRGDVARRAVVEQPAHERDSRATPLGQLGQHAVERPEQARAHGERVVQRTLRAVRVEQAGQVEDRTGGRRHRDAVDRGDVMGQQQARAMKRGERFSVPVNLVRPDHVELGEPEAGQSPQGGGRSMRGRRALTCVEYSGHERAVLRSRRADQPQHPRREWLPLLPTHITT